MVSPFIAALVATPLLLGALILYGKLNSNARGILIFSIVFLLLYKAYGFFQPLRMLPEEFSIPHSDWIVEVTREVPWGVIGPAIQGTQYVEAVNIHTGSTIPLMHISELYDFYLSFETPDNFVITLQKGEESEAVKQNNRFGDFSVSYRIVPYDVALLHNCAKLWEHRSDNPPLAKNCVSYPNQSYLYVYKFIISADTEWKKHYQFWLENHMAPDAEEWCRTNIERVSNSVKSCP